MICHYLKAIRWTKCQELTERTHHISKPSNLHLYPVAIDNSGWTALQCVWRDQFWFIICFLPCFCPCSQEPTISPPVTPGSTAWKNSQLQNFRQLIWLEQINWNQLRLWDLFCLMVESIRLLFSGVRRGKLHTSSNKDGSLCTVTGLKF